MPHKPAHVHLCWELGGGLGHAGRLKMLAQALLARGHRVTMSLRDLVHTRALLADLDVPKLQAPVWLHPAAGLPPSGNLAEVLFHCGYLQPQALRGMVDGWRALFQLLQPDLVVADFAPTALLAARSLGLRSASVGSGYNTPPPGRPLPALRQAPAARLASSEARVLATANAVLSAYGAPAYTQAADIFLGALPLLCTWPELDPYERDADADWLGPNFAPDSGIAPHWPEGHGPKVFAYLKAAHAAHGVVLRSLAEEGCRVLAYVPEVAAGAPPPVVTPHILYADAPVALGRALREADLCVSHAGEATLAQALLAGAPLLMLPMQTEQFLTARRVALSGAGYNAALIQEPAAWRAVIRRVLDEPAFAAAAAGFAARYRGFNPVQQNAELAGLLERLFASSQVDQK